MHIPGNHPSLTPASSGRGKRFVTNTTAIRPIRLDQLSDKALSELKMRLAGEGRDTASASLITRRSLRRYQAYVATLSPPQLDAEKLAVREMSQLPTPRCPSGKPRKAAAGSLTPH